MGLSSTSRVCFAIVRGGTVLVPTYDVGFFAATGAGTWFATRADWTATNKPVEDLSAYVLVVGANMGGMITVRSQLPPSYWTEPGAQIEVDLTDDNGLMGTLVLHLRALPDYFIAHGTITDAVPIASPSGAVTFSMSVAAPPAAAGFDALRFAPGTNRLELPVAFAAWPAAVDDAPFSLDVAVTDSVIPANSVTASFTGASRPFVTARRLEGNGEQLAGFAMVQDRIPADAGRGVDVDLPAGSVASATGLRALTFDRAMRILETQSSTGSVGTGLVDLVIDVGGGRPPVRRTSLPLELHAVAYAVAWDFAAGVNRTLVDPVGNAFVYTNAESPAPFTIGGVGTTALALSWVANSLTPGASVTLDVRMRRNLPGYAEEHVVTPLSIGALPSTIDVVPVLGTIPSVPAESAYSLRLMTSIAQGTNETLSFGLDTESAPLPFELVDDSPPRPDHKVLRTAGSGLIPAAWQPERVVRFQPSLRDGATGVLLSGGNIVQIRIAITPSVGGGVAGDAGDGADAPSPADDSGGCRIGVGSGPLSLCLVPFVALIVIRRRRGL